MSIYQTVTDDIIQQLEAGVRPWAKSWTSKGSFVPFNVHTKAAYRGINILLLWSAAAKKGYATHAWMGYREAFHLGAHVRKGEKSTRGIYYNVVEKEDGEKKAFVRMFNVFNVEQLEDLPPDYKTEPEPLPEGDLSEMITRTKIPVFLGCPKPCYIPSLDRVEMPNRSDFESMDDFASTLFHEMAHSTKHPSRLDRKVEHTKDGYSQEELLAELSSAFVCAATGYSYNDAQSPAYIDGWLKVLKADSRAIVTLSSQASKVADWLLQTPA